MDHARSQTRWEIRARQNPLTTTLIIAVSLAAMVTLTACPKRITRSGEISQKFHTVSELLAAMAKSRPESLKVTGMVEYRNASQRIKVRISYVARQPAFLRFETESFFDQPLSILVTDGMVFSSWDMKNGRFITGNATMANISRVIPVPMDGADIARMLLGQAPMIAYASEKLEVKHGQYLLTVSNARQVESILINPENLTPTRIKLSTNNELTYTLELSDWLTQEGKALVPGKIRFEIPNRKIKVRIKLFSAESGTPPDDKLFHLDIPDGVDIENWK